MDMRAWWRLLRPAHWVKNLFVLAPLLFARHLFEPALILDALAAFAAFCLWSSAVYSLNDVLDAKSDRVHPLKRRRPIAAGEIRPRAALVFALVLASVATAGAWLLHPYFASIGLAYLANNILYSLWLKRVAFLDVVLIAAGFVMRVVGGALAIQVIISPWVVVCTFFLACLLGFGKRRHELDMRGEKNATRPSLGGYTPTALRVAELVVAIVTLVSYFFYTIAPGTVDKFGTWWLVATLPFPAFGIYRFLLLVRSGKQEAPTDMLVTDWPMWINIVAWVGAVAFILYSEAIC
ncbi:MAG: decaprenyl-phosphate phosphoribosyltransferase [Deltaproteobacteria bacterium]|nr:decaprenyl-phosphate phosphoribosyltransferase [Deltaproteobacteria bacterium]